MKKVIILLLLNFICHFSNAQVTSANPDTIDNNFYQQYITFSGTGVTIGSPRNVFLIHGLDSIQAGGTGTITTVSFRSFFNLDSPIDTGLYSLSYNDNSGTVLNIPDLVRVVQGAPVADPIIFAPVNNFVTNLNYVDFVWSPISGAYYQLRIGTDSTFSTPSNYTLINIGSTGTRNVPIQNGVYYWSIRTVFSGHVSAYTAPSKITCTALPILTRLTPDITYSGNSSFLPILSGMNTNFKLGSNSMNETFTQGSTAIYIYQYLPPPSDTTYPALFRISLSVPSGLYNVNASNIYNGPMVLYNGLYITDPHQVSGMVFYDLNSNGLYDGSDIAYDNMQVNTGIGTLYTATGGLYSGYVPDGTYSVQLGSPFNSYYSSNPPLHSVTFGSGNRANLNFALTPISGIHDLFIGLSSPTSAYQIGFNKSFMINYRNQGTEIESGVVKFVLPPGLNFISASDPGFTMSGDTMIWNFSSFGLTERRTIQIESFVPNTLTLGTTLSAYSEIEGNFTDETVWDNSSVHTRTVVNSVDPNIKSVTPENLSSTNLSTGEYLNYTINFQNTGNYTATTIRILDTMSVKLDLSTLEIIGFSHPVRMISYPNRVIEFRFDNINLLDIGSNEALSHGFISYRIKSNSGLNVTDAVLNTAYIYFDFNAPVKTNDCLTQVIINVDEFSHSTNDLKIYPNPASSKTKILYPFDGKSKVVLMIFDESGKLVKQINYPSMPKGEQEIALNLSGLTNGVYRIVVSDGKTSRTNNFVIQK